jgi:Putative transposase/Transposase zinc-binding domain
MDNVGHSDPQATDMSGTQIAFERCSLQGVFVRHFGEFAATRKLHPRERRAAQCIAQCYTGALGAHLLKCPQGHVQRVQPHACRHRSCPRCVEPARSRWIDAQLQRLLPCPHFHTVFTLPHELLPLWTFNRQRMTQLLFESARDSLLQLMADPRRLGVMPGVLMTLHTWGRTLSYHPHLHCLVTAGGLSAQSGWIGSRAHVPISALPLKKLFRGKFLHELGRLLEHRGFTLPAGHDGAHWRGIIRALYREDFNVEVGDAYPHGRGVALYLARYVKGGPLPKERALFCNGTHVCFDYTDHRDGRTKRLTLQIPHFIERILWHAPPAGQHLTRYAGLYSHAHRAHYRNAVQALQPPASTAAATPTSVPHRPAPNAAQPPAVAPPPAPLLCPQCGHRLLRLLQPRMHQHGEFSIQPPELRRLAKRLPLPRAPPPARSNPSVKLTRNGNQ